MGKFSREAAEIVTLPAGDYAIVEMFGHTKLVGRISEVERFGVKMMALEPIVCFEMLPAIFIGGMALYSITPCSADVALAKAPISEWSVPDSLRAVLPPAMLPSPEVYEEPPAFAPRFLNDEDNDVEQRADAEDAAAFVQPEIEAHPKGCTCLYCEMPF